MNRLDLMAQSILLVLASWTGGVTQPINSNDSLSWQAMSVSSSRVVENSFETTEFTSQALKDACATSPNLNLDFPRIKNGIQQFYLDDTLVYSDGDPNREIFESLSGIALVSCLEVNRAGSHRWMVHRFSTFHRLSSYPYLTTQISGRKLYDRVSRISSAMILLTLAAFMLVLFWKKASSLLVLCVCLASLCFSLDFLLEEAASFGIDMPLVLRRCLIFTCISLGEVFFGCALYIKNLIPKPLMLLLCGSSIVSLIIYPFLGHPDSYQCVRFLFQYGPNFLIEVSLLAGLAHLWREALSSLRILQIAMVLVFVAGHWWDMLFHLGMNSGPLVMPISYVAAFVFFALVLSIEIGEGLKESYEVAKRTAIAVSIAGATQKIAHDLKGPFVLINNFIHVIAARKLGDHSLDSLTPYVMESIKYADHLISNILVGNARRPARFEPLDLRDVIDFSWNHSLHRGAEVTLEVCLNQENILLADKERMRRLFINLFDNAVEAMPPGSRRVWVHADDDLLDEQDCVKIVVGNEGSYIAPERAAQLFRALNSEGKEGGNGLGLLICEEIIRSHGGRIYCRSNPDLGTEFVFFLPVLYPSVAEEVGNNARAPLSAAGHDGATAISRVPFS